jgi:hypothetical protein
MEDKKDKKVGLFRCMKAINGTCQIPFGEVNGCICYHYNEHEHLPECGMECDMDSHEICVEVKH